MLFFLWIFLVAWISIWINYNEEFYAPLHNEWSLTFFLNDTFLHVSLPGGRCQYFPSWHPVILISDMTCSGLFQEYNMFFTYQMRYYGIECLTTLVIYTRLSGDTKMPWSSLWSFLKERKLSTCLLRLLHWAIILWDIIEKFNQFGAYCYQNNFHCG